jgi:DNA repair exonuclease SbcCD ATPase subunit
MQPLKLIIEDFLCYSKAEIDFDDFSSAVIIGKMNGNEKFSNGSGKTTIFSAIKYALFNKIDASSLDQVIRHDTDLCKVIFDFKSTVDNEIYRIVRIKPRGAGTDVSLFILSNNKFEPISAKTASQTEKEIAKLIKINYETFCNSTLFAQSDLGGLAALTPGARKKALKEALQLNIYSKFEKTTAKKISDIVKDIDKNKTIINVIESDKETIQSIDNKILDKSNEIKKLQFEIDEDLKVKSKILNELTNLQVVKSQSKDIAIKKNELEIVIRKQSIIVDDYNKKLSNIKNTIISLEKEVIVIDAYINKYVQMDTAPIIKETEILLSLILEQKLQFKTIQSKLDELNIPMPDASVCKHCRQELSSEHRIICQNEIEKEKQNITKILKELQISIPSKQKEYDANKKKIIAIDTINKELEVKKTDVRIKNKDIENKKSLFNELFSLFGKNKAELNANKISYDEIKDKVIDNKLDANITKCDLKIKECIFDVNEHNKRISNIMSDRAVLESRRADRLKDLDKISEYKKIISTLEISYILHQKVLQAFSHSGIPALITHTILDDFQIETNALLSQLRPGLQLEFSVIKDRDDGDKDDTLNIFYNLNGHQLEYALLSGAQKLIVSLCLKLGLAAVLKKRLGTDIKLFMIDEVDQSLDEGGLEAFEAAIKKLQKDFKILIITHNKELKDKFNHAILVEQDQNFVSTARVVSEW